MFAIINTNQLRKRVPKDTYLYMREIGLIKDNIVHIQDVDGGEYVGKFSIMYNGKVFTYTVIGSDMSNHTPNHDLKLWDENARRLDYLLSLLPTDIQDFIAHPLSVGDHEAAACGLGYIRDEDPNTPYPPYADYGVIPMTNKTDLIDEVNVIDVIPTETNDGELDMYIFFEKTKLVSTKRAVQSTGSKTI